MGAQFPLETMNVELTTNISSMNELVQLRATGSDGCFLLAIIQLKLLFKKRETR